MVDHALGRLASLPAVWADASSQQAAADAAESLVRIANSTQSGYSLARAEADLRAHTPPGHAGKEHDERWAWACKRVGVDWSPEGSAIGPQEASTDQQARRGEVRTLRLTRASDIDPEPVVWAWKDGGEGRIPSGSLVMAAGREGTGKSSFGIWKAARISTGTLPGNLYGGPRVVFYVAVEDSWSHTLVPRLMAAGADLSRIYRVDAVRSDDSEVTLSLPTDNKQLEAAIAEHAAALVVIDPLMSVMGEGIDTHKNREVRRALDPLALMASSTGAIILGIAHFGKSNGSDPASLISGSGAFKDVPRAIFGFARDESEDDAGRRVMSQVKNSLGRDNLPSLTYAIETAAIATPRGQAETGRLVFTGTSDRSVEQILRESGRDPDAADEASEAAEWLKGYLSEHGGSSGAGETIKAGAAAGIGKTALTRARKAAGVVTSKAGFGSGWVWSLSDSLPPRDDEEPEESTS
ncbi:hypothetical protein Back2_18220 [Nocardioides baekrokdamisoli]|uniref:AAA+ ATPase domain-containing protein n=2 Tax=Nocardioides baekrokdamisoli TaxID=1804624 RepID=A0A3G9INC2_9ACTN|nr:hypothetical protein Back2_18220 [Nocardioides baekrokdamisoli]